MSKVFVVDIARCNGCHNCQVACKDEHCEQPWLPYAQAQPLTGQFWMRVDEKVRGQVPVVKMAYTPTFCTHCADAPCMAAAAAAGQSEAVYRRQDGLVIIDPVQATGCREIQEACPLGAIYYNEELDLPQKCTGCAHLLDNGWELPRCVDACATDALRYLDESEVDLSLAKRLPATANCGPRVYYYHLPQRFVAGLVMDEAAQEVMIGVDIALQDTTGATLATSTSDEFGDYRFDQLEPGMYTVVIRPGSIDEIRLSADLCTRDLYLGDTNIARTE